MSERLDALMVRPYTTGNGETKNSYTKVGVAFPLDGGGYRLKFDAIPVPTIYDGKVELSMLLVPPRDRDGDKPSQSASQPSYGSQKPRASQAPAFGDGPDDDLPFAPEWRV